MSRITLAYICRKSKCGRGLCTIKHHYDDDVWLSLISICGSSGVDIDFDASVDPNRADAAQFSRTLLAPAERYAHPTRLTHALRTSALGLLNLREEETPSQLSEMASRPVLWEAFWVFGGV